MKRPYVPLKVRLAVLERQAYAERTLPNYEYEQAREWYQICCGMRSTRGKIKWLLALLFDGQKAELDHDPALELRRFNKRTGHYVPHENNPKFLVYRLVPEHLRKTVGRTPGAERTVTTKGSDVWLAKKFRKLEHPKKSKSKLQSRPFPKAKRPFRSRTSLSATRAGKGF